MHALLHAFSVLSLRARAALRVTNPAACFFAAALAMSAHGENESEKAPPAEGAPQKGAKFVPPPDPSSLPTPLPLPVERKGQGSLDLLPSFPSGAPAVNTSDDLNILDLVIKKRENPSLIPDGPNPTEDAALALNRRHRYQTARSQALNEPEVQGALAAAQKARSDREFREALRRHYTLLFSKMRQLDSSLEPLIHEREVAAFEPLKGGVQTASSNGALKK